MAQSRRRWNSSTQTERFAVTDQRLFETTYSLTCHAIEQVRATMLLIEAGLPYPARVNARVAFQHAITVQWMIYTRGGDVAVISEMQRQRDVEIGDAKRSMELPDHLTEKDPDAATLPKSKGPAKNFLEMVERFSPNRALLAVSSLVRLGPSVLPDSCSACARWSWLSPGNPCPQ